MKNRLSKNQNGAAALITVIFVSIILSIMVLGFVRLAVREQRQSTDNDLTSRAFYAAESGIEDAKRAVRAYIAGSVVDLKGNVCDPAEENSVAYENILSPPTEFDTEYTCQLIDLEPSEYAATLLENETIQIELDSGGTAFSRVVIEWHEPSVDGTPYALRGASDIPKKINWNSSGTQFPAMLRSEMFGYPNGSFNRAQLKNSSVAFLNPFSGASLTAVAYTITPPTVAVGVKNAFCAATASPGNYACKQTYSVTSSSGKHFLRLTSLYRGTDFKVTLQAGAATNVPIEGAQFVVDVTGRAGDVFRRVETRIDLTGSFNDLLLPNGITSNDSICKNLKIPDTPANGPLYYRANDCSL